MSFLSQVGPVARSPDSTQQHQPIINYLSEGELDRLDKEREKEANRRRKRNTRGRRGVALPDREPLKTHRTPAIGFPEIDPQILAIVTDAAAAAARLDVGAEAAAASARMMLYKVCLFRMLDSLAHFWGQARENVHKAVDVKDPNEKQAILGESLRYARTPQAIF